jgi:multidrug efflux system membrane fusion protein
VRKAVIFALIAAALAAGFLAWRIAAHHASAQAAGQAQAPAAIPVAPGAAEAKDVPLFISGIGTVQAFNTVSVRSRVDGQITKVFFTEGEDVKAGEPLFQIDPRPFQAALDQAQAARERDQAQLEGAQRNLDRYAKLVVPGYQTRQSYEDQQATVAQLKASVKADEVQIESAKLNLDYALITAPIDGRTGQRLVDIGNFIQSNQNTSLVTITQLKPIFVGFTVPQESLDSIRQNQAKQPLDVVAYGQDDKTVLSKGKLTLIDNQVDVATGTIRLKATFENADERLWPGEFVNARLILSVVQNAVTVPAQTVMQGPNGPYLYVIKPDDTVEHRDVKVETTQDDLAVIAQGLSAGERVVVDGQYRLTDGAKVKIAASQASASPQ